MKQSKVNLKELFTSEKRSWHIIDQNHASKKVDIHLSLITLNQQVYAQTYQNRGSCQHTAPQPALAPAAWPPVAFRQANN